MPACIRGETLYLWWQPLFRDVAREKHYIYGGNHCLGMWQRGKHYIYGGNHCLGMWQRGKHNIYGGNHCLGMWQRGKHYIYGGNHCLGMWQRGIIWLCINTSNSFVLVYQIYSTTICSMTTEKQVKKGDNDDSITNNDSQIYYTTICSMTTGKQIKTCYSYDSMTNNGIPG